MRHSQIAYLTEQILSKIFFHSMISLESGKRNWGISLESDEMSALWQNDHLTFTFHYTFSNSTPSSKKFIKEVYGFDTWFTKWWNDCFVRKWLPNFHFLLHTCILEYLHTGILVYLHTCILDKFGQFQNVTCNIITLIRVS